MEEHSYDHDKFEHFLEEVRSATGDERLYMFIDNCGVHHSHFVTKKFRDLNIMPIWNLPYSPEYNAAIEMYWGQLKAKYRPILLQKMLTVPRAKDKPMLESIH